MADTHTINDPNINPTNIDTNLDNDLSLNSSAFLLHNGFHNDNKSPAAAAGLQNSDIEMTTLQAATYTSLKDLLPSSPTPAAIMSPTNNSSWNEIPIKNPLVKHAALAYLQPMSSPPEVGEKGFLGKLKDVLCCCQCECFGWINHVVFRGVKEVFWDRREEEIDEDEEDEEKVD